MAQLLLQKAYRQLQKEPLEGFYFEPNEANIFDWKIYLEGPKETPFEGGVFELKMKFPSDYPMSPPTLHFVSEFWHPNVYKDGKVCISILHPPVDDPMSGERPEERWMPCQTVETIMLSVQSMLGDPNYSSPANVDASVECRDRQTNYCKRIKGLINKANSQLPKHVKIAHPETNPKKKKAELDEDMIAGVMDDYDLEVDYMYGGDEYYCDDESQTNGVASQESSEKKEKQTKKESKESKEEEIKTTKDEPNEKPKKEKKKEEIKTTQDEPKEKPKMEKKESRIHQTSHQKTLFFVQKKIHFDAPRQTKKDRKIQK